MSNSLPDESTNVKWMYEGANSSIDREQYLLGKRISKVPEDKGDFIVENTTNDNLSVSVLERLDYESKVREDPLFAIRKKEDEKRRELLSNPVKRKRLQSALKNALIKDLESSLRPHKSSKSSKKHKRRHAVSSSESSDESTSDDESSKQLIASANKDGNLHAALKKALEKDLGVVSTSSESDEKSRRKKKHKKKSKHSKDYSHKSHKKKHKTKRSSESDKHSSDSERPAKRDKEADRREGYGLIVVKPRDKADVSHQRKKRSRTPPPVKEKYVRKERSGFTRKLNKVDLEKKRKEMMANASWRDDQRRKNVENYSKEEERERHREQKIQQHFDSKMRKDGKVKTFLHDMRLKQASIGSLEDTVRRKRHTLDRSSQD